MDKEQQEASLPEGDARLRILDVAERLFMSLGYNSVRLRDVAAPLGLSHAALYYHFPGGKEALFIEVMERNIRRHGEGLGAAMAAPSGRLRDKLRGAAAWLLSQPPMDLIRMAETDLRAIDPEAGRRLGDLVYTLILRQLQDAFQSAKDGGEVGPCDPGLLGGALLGLVESLHAVPVDIVGRSRLAMAEDLIDIVLKGIDYRAD